MATDKKIRVLHIIKSLGRGGAEMLLPETLASHDQSNFEFYYIYFLPWKDQMVQALKNSGGTVQCISATNNARIFATIPALRRYISKHQIDLIHCHLPWAGIVGRIAGKLTGVPVIYSEHNKWERYHNITFRLNKLTFGWQQKVIAVSADVAESILKFYKQPVPDVQVVLNGVNTNKFNPADPIKVDIKQELNISSAAKVIGIISVFRTQKRLITWLEIASAIHAQNDDTYFIIVGDGPLNKEIRRRACDLKMESYLHFAGLQTEVRPYLQAMDVFMMSSEFEGLPIALLEAMSMGCVPVCTMAGGIPELVKDGENGLLVPVELPGELSGKVLDLLNDAQQLKQLSVAARHTVVENFSMKRMTLEIESIYKTQLGIL